MKKTYIAPDVELTFVEISRMIATSSLDVNKESEDEIENEEEFLSRRRNNVWDEEEENF